MRRGNDDDDRFDRMSPQQKENWAFRMEQEESAEQERLNREVRERRALNEAARREEERSRY